MIDNKSIKTMQAGLDALWLKQKVHSNNIANSETAGFKAGEVSFKTRLDQAKQHIESIQVQVKQNQGLSNRLDGNNVDLEKEQLALWETYAQYNYVTQSLNKQLSNLRYVINNTGK